MHVTLPLAALVAISIGVHAPQPPQGATPTSPSAQTATSVTPAQGTTRPDPRVVRVYHDRLSTVVDALPAGASLAGLLAPMLELAASRTPDSRGIEENRAALLAVVLYVNGSAVHFLMPEAREWPRAASRGLTLRGRHDLAQHFTVSAYVAAVAGSPLADFIGIYKEVLDSRGGSGFSFADLAADRSGRTLGMRATTDEEWARRLHTRTQAGLSEADLMPSIDELPEGLNESEFSRRFAARSPAYTRLVEEIDRRIAALRLFQQP